MIFVVVCLSAYLGLLPHIPPDVIFWLDADLEILRPLMSGQALYVIDVLVLDRDLGVLSPLTSLFGTAAELLVALPVLPVAYVDIQYSQCAGITPWSSSVELPPGYPSNQYGWNPDVLKRMILDVEKTAIVKYYEGFGIPIYDVRVDWGHAGVCHACSCDGRTYHLLTSEAHADRAVELGREIYH